MEKYKAYVSVANQRVYFQPDVSAWEYEVSLEREYIPIFQNLFEQTNEMENMNFYRSHFPFIPAHYGGFNKDVEMRTKKVYALIHEFTDEETQKFIEELPYFR
ncbi:transposase [Sporosarcina sp. FA9]|uniref:transposase n=1 Tax=Sporosarcina sp. FA9 TaxID=3413030 RepID=UPI003F65E32D